MSANHHQIRIVTRTSALAMWQANHVRSQLLAHHPELDIEIIGIKTAGDKWQDVPLYKIGGKSVFVKELEEALLQNKADIAVHSLKDVPAQFPDGLMLGAVLKRESPFDAWLCRQRCSLADIPAHSRVGTSSLRRLVQLKLIRPDLNYIPLRGNIDTRVKKMQEGEYDAIVLAQAGLQRLQMTDHITSTFSADQLLPAVGQGALGIECRQNDERTLALLKVLDDPTTRACVLAERAMNAELGGSCQVPIGGFALLHEGKLTLTGRVGHPDKGILLQAQRQGTIPENLGAQVAFDLIEQGAAQIIKEILDSHE